MNKKQAISDLLQNEAVKSVIAHAELYNNLPVSASNFWESEILNQSRAQKTKPVKEQIAKIESTESTNIPKVQTVAEKIIPKRVVLENAANDSELTASLADLKNEVSSCVACSLHKTRKQIVFGEGSNRIPLVCIGEAPGEEEDKSGSPFVGKAGQLLTRMLEAININRSDIYICNVLKCRPPMNRDPNSDEVASCSGYLDRQLAILKPMYILALGRIAAKRLLKLDYTMAQFRTQMYEYQGVPVLVTYHPSALLRNPNWKQPAWDDLQKLQKLLGL